MDVAEFDKFADEYHNLHQENIRITEENPEYFAEYKICDLSRVEQIIGGRDARVSCFFPAILKLLRPLEKWLTWFPLGAQYFVVGKKQ